MGFSTNWSNRIPAKPASPVSSFSSFVVCLLSTKVMSFLRLQTRTGLSCARNHITFNDLSQLVFFPPFSWCTCLLLLLHRTWLKSVHCYVLKPFSAVPSPGSLLRLVPLSLSWVLALCCALLVQFGDRQDWQVVPAALHEHLLVAQFPVQEQQDCMSLYTW